MYPYEDVIVALGSQSFTGESFRLYSGKESPGRVRITVLRGENQIDVDLDLQRFSLANFFDIKLPDIINGLGFWLLAIAVYRVRPDDPVNRVFALAMSFVGASLWLTINSIFPESTNLTRALDLVWVGFATFIGVTTIHLATLFPHPMHRSMSRFITLLYIAMIGIGFLYALSLPLRWANETAISNTLSSFGNVIVNNWYGVSALFYLARLLYLVAQPNVTKRVRRQAIFLLLGISLALPYIIVITVRTLSTNSGSYFWNDLDLRYLTLAVPIAFAFSILRYQTFQRTHSIVIAALRSYQPTWSVNGAAQTVGLAALNDFHCLRHTLELTQHNAATLRESLIALGADVVKSSTHFCLINVGDSAAWRRQPLRVGCLVRDCASFGLPSHIRIGTRLPKQNNKLIEAWKKSQLKT